MENLIQAINTIFSAGTVLFWAVSLMLIIGLIGKDRSVIYGFFAKHALAVVFLVSFGGLLGSMVYSEFIGFTPCMLCWYQRIAMYPIAVISAVALVRKKANEVWNYALTLSILGGAVAVFHNYEQLIGVEVVPCPAGSVSCLQELVKGFGFIDIPLMSLTFFVFIILIILNRKRFSSTTTHS